jgi:hypothetical protein
MLGSLPVVISVSLDGATPDVFERIRVGARFSDVIGNLDRFRRHAAESGTSVTINHCLMVENALHFAELLAFADRRDLHVHVNTVTHPARFSVYRLPDDELEDLLGRMAVTLDRVAPLRRNADVWHDQMRRLRQHLDGRRETAPTPGVTGVRSEPRERRSLARDVAEGLAAGGPVHTIELRGSETVARVSPDVSDVLGMDLEPLIGGHISALLSRFTAGFGELESSELTQLQEGIEVRRFRFGSGMRLWAVLAVGGSAGDDRWYLGGRSDPEVAG